MKNNEKPKRPYTKSKTIGYKTDKTCTENTQSTANSETQSTENSDTIGTENTQSKANTQNSANPHNITRVKKYLNKTYLLRRNIIGNCIEYTRKNENSWKELNHNDLVLELVEKKFGVSEKLILTLLRSSFVPDSNPIKAYFDALPSWDGSTDYIQLLADFVQTTDRERFVIHFKKMLVRVVVCGLGLGFNKQMFLLVGGQDAGKSSFLRFLCPDSLQAYFKEDLEFENKDGRLALAQNFIINIDEIDKLQKKDVAKVKEMISKDVVKERLMYGTKDTKMKRIASFFGSTNKTEFLGDETGSVRFVCFNVCSIDFAYKQMVDMDKVFSQAYSLFLGGFKYELSKEDVVQNELINKAYTVCTTEIDLVQKHCEKADLAQKNFKTTTEILHLLKNLYPHLPIHSNTLGKALSFCGFERHNGKAENVSKKGYYLILE